MSEEFKKISCGSPIKFLYLGRLDQEKDLFTLLDAALLLKNAGIPFTLNIVGQGHKQEELKNYIKRHSLENFIKFFGYVSDKDLVSVYNEADFYVSPSLYELEGMSVLEAMSCGLPIILSDSKHSAAKSFVNGNGYIFKASNSSDLFDVLKKAINLENSEYIKMCRISLRTAKKHSFTKSVKQLEDIFYSVISEKKLK